MFTANQNTSLPHQHTDHPNRLFLQQAVELDEAPVFVQLRRITHRHVKNITTDSDSVLQHQVVFIEFSVAGRHAKNQRHALCRIPLGYFRKESG